MLNLLINDFLAIFPLQMPELLDRNQVSQPQIYGDYALLDFKQPTPLSLDQVADMFDEGMELVLLYVHIPSSDTEFGRSCCAYSNPAFGRMFKMNASTNSSGMVEHIMVTIYADLEFMSGEVINDLALHSRMGFFKYHRAKEDVLLNFIG